MSTIEVDISSVALANIALTKCLVDELLTSGQFSPERMAAVFAAAGEELGRMAVALSPDDAHKVLSLFWAALPPLGVQRDLN